MADTIERIYRLTVDGAQAARDLNAIAKATENADKRFEAAFASIKKFAGVLTAGFTAATVIQSIKRNIDAMDELSKSVQKVGIAAEDLQRLRYAADLSGVSAESLDKAVKSLAVGMGDLATGTDDTAKALRAIGAKSGDDPVVVLDKIADQFEKMPDGIAKTNLAITLFGKKIGPDLIPMLNGGSAALKELREEADRFGGVVSQKTLTAAESFNDNLSRLQRTLAGIMAQITAGMLPALQAISQDLTNAATKGDGFVSTGEAIGDVLLEIYGVAIKATATMQAFTRVFQTLQEIREHPTGAVSFIRSMIADINLLEANANLKLTAIRENLRLARLANEAAPLKPPGKDEDPMAKIRAAEAAAEAEKKRAKELEKQENDRMSRAAILIQIEKDEAKVQEDLIAQAERHKKELIDLDAIRDEMIETIDKQNKASQDEAARLQVLVNLYESGTEEQKKYAAAQLAATAASVASTETMVKQRDEIDVLTDGFNSFFDNLAKGAADVEDIFKRMVQSVIAELLKLWAKKYIIDTLASFFDIAPAAKPAATGFAFDASGAIPFARGGVLTQPIMFPMALAGEAGPEAIVPLRRTASGDLGIQAQQSQMKITVNNYSNATVTTRQRGPNDVEIIVEQARAAIAADLRNGGNAVSRSLEQSYGIGRGAAASF